MKSKRFLTGVMTLTMIFGSGVSIYNASAPAVFAEESAGELRWPEYKKLEPNSTLKEFQQRIADWEGCGYSDCIMLSEGDFLTPTKPYHINKSRITLYRVYVTEGTELTREAIYEKWLELLRAHGIPEKSLANIEHELYIDDVIAKDEDGVYNIISPVMNGYMGIDYIDVLSSFDNVEKIEARFSYNTHSRVNSTGGYSFFFNSDTELTAEDLPEGLNVRSVEKRGDMGCYELRLDSSDYTDYYEFAPFLLAKDVKDVALGYYTTELADSRDEAYIASPDWEVVYEKSGSTQMTKPPKPDIDKMTASDPTLLEFQQRIAGWEDAQYEDCIMISDKQFMTPNKLYDISRLRMTSYRVTLDEGTELDESDVLKKWTDILSENGYPDSSLRYLKATVTDAGEGDYYVSIPGQEGYKGLSFLDVLKDYDNVDRIRARFGYRTDSRPNYTSDYTLYFNYDGEDRITAESFDESLGVESVEFCLDTDRAYTLKLDTDRYSDYFDFMPYLISKGARDIFIGCCTTELADANDDAMITCPDWEVLYQRESKADESSESMAEPDSSKPDTIVPDESEAPADVTTCDEDSKKTDAPEGSRSGREDNSSAPDKSDKTIAFKPGDASGDGVIDIEDAAAMINHINGVSVLDGIMAEAADIDDNGTLDVEDIARLMNHINGVNPLF